MSKSKKKMQGAGGTHENSFFQKLKIFFTDERTRFAIGLIVLLFAVYLFLAFTSFFFTGANDQSKLENVGMEELTASRNEIMNWAGARGARIANLCLNEWMGISSYFIIVFLLILSLRLMRIKKYSMLKWFIICSIAMIWASVTLNFFL